MQRGKTKSSWLRAGETERIREHLGLMAEVQKIPETIKVRKWSWHEKPFLHSEVKD